MDAGEKIHRSSLFVSSVEKCFEILGAFEGKRYFSLSDLCTKTGYDKSTVQRMTHTLAELGYLEQSTETRRFALSTRVLDLSYHYLRNNPLVERATPVLIGLRRDFDERVDLSLYANGSLVYAQRHQSQREHYFTSLVGRRVPLFCSAGGRAVLATLEDKLALEIIEATDLRPLTRFTEMDRARIMAKVRTARADGFAIARNEVIEDEVAIAVALVGDRKEPVGALHVVANSAKWTDTQMIEKFLPGMMRAAAILEGVSLG